MPEKKLIKCKYNPQLKVAAEVTEDVKFSEANDKAIRFTFGELGSAISGAIHFNREEVIPMMVILMIPSPQHHDLVLNEETDDSEKTDTP